MIPWLCGSPFFPPIENALEEPNGLLAAGGELTPAWLLTAYRHGIFPWFNEGEPILWWSPNPRLVLKPAEIHISRTLRRLLRRKVFDVRLNTAFSEVLQGCAAPRLHSSATWITPEIQEAYTHMHQLGFAHSVECWQGGELVGGLYGMAVGRLFFGESMFHRVSDASKVAFAHLAWLLEKKGYQLIDCQMTTPHLVSMGAKEISRAVFHTYLSKWATIDTLQSERWQTDEVSGIKWA